MPVSFRLVRRVALIAAALALPCALGAQEPAPPPPAAPDSGARVRVYAPTLLDARITGRFLYATPDSLFVLREGPGAAPAHLFAVSRPEVRAFEVSRGGRGRSTTRGALIGGALFAALGVFITLPADEASPVEIRSAIAGTTIFGAVLGGLLGGTGEDWDPVPVPAPPPPEG